MQSNIKTDDPVMTTSEVARLLGVATSTVQIWMESGAIESWKTPGGHRRTRLSLVQGLLHGKDDNAHRRPAASNDKEHIARWMNEGKLAKVSDAQALEWQASDARLWASVVNPFVLVQPDKKSLH